MGEVLPEFKFANTFSFAMYGVSRHCGPMKIFVIFVLSILAVSCSSSSVDWEETNTNRICGFSTQYGRGSANILATFFMSKSNDQELAFAVGDSSWLSIDENKYYPNIKAYVDNKKLGTIPPRGSINSSFTMTLLISDAEKIKNGDNIIIKKDDIEILKLDVSDVDSFIDEMKECSESGVASDPFVI